MSALPSIDFKRPIPLFPLANCVLLPHCSVPLHIFEHRYRAMTRHALDSAGVIAMATLRPNFRDHPTVNPPLRHVVCAGQIMRYHQLPDGRYNMLMQGVARARIIEELSPSTQGYRMAYLESIEDSDVMEIDLEEQRQAIEKHLTSPAMNSLANIDKITNLLNQELPTAALVDMAASVLCHNAEDRYNALAQCHSLERARWFADYLAEIHACLKIADKLGSAQTTDGLSLN